MKLKLAYYGAPVLRKKGALIDKIDESLHQLIEAMIEVMDANNGCGLAAPQVHHSKALFITRIPVYADEVMVDPGKVRVFINPKIISYSDEMWACGEACLSIPGLSKTVVRPMEVVFEYTDLEGKKQEERFSEFDAHVMMHENDHINGVLYVDRLPPKIKKEIEPFLRGVKKKFAN